MHRRSGGGLDWGGCGEKIRANGITELYTESRIIQLDEFRPQNT